MVSSPVSIEEVRAWTRLDTDADDEQLGSLLLAATAYASSYTGLTITADDCPEPVRQAIIVFVADSYANREGQLVGSEAVRRLLDMYRVVSL